MTKKQVWTNYQSKESPETEIVYVVTDGQIIQSPTAIVGQVESEYLFYIFLTANNTRLKFQQGLC
jgi:hypothetical protein